MSSLPDHDASKDMSDDEYFENIQPHSKAEANEDDEHLPTYSREEVLARLSAAGLPSLVNEQQSLPSLVGDIRGHFLRTGAAPALYSLRGRDLTGLIPPGLESYPVWYITLPPDMEEKVSVFIQSAIVGCCGGLTSDPWVNAVFIELVTLEQLKERFSREGQQSPSLSFQESPGVMLWLAATMGCVIVVFDCAGQLHLTGYPVDESHVLELQACESSSFQRPLRCNSVRSLQERTRAVEETGRDPESGPGCADIVLPVMVMSTGPGHPVTKAPQIRVDSPTVSWSRSESAIGRVRHIVAFVPPHLRDSEDLFIRSTVRAQFFESLTQSPLQAAVTRLAVPGCDECYRVVLRSGCRLSVITMYAADERFQEAYLAWASAGICPIAVENLRNGRCFITQMAWPADFRGASPGKKLALGQVASRSPGSDKGLMGLVEALAANEGVDLECACSDPIDENEFEPNS